MKLKTILASAAALAATATVATTVYAATYTFAGFDQGFALVKDEKGNVRPGAELKDGKADLTKYGLGVIDTNQESPVTDKEKEEIFAPSFRGICLIAPGLDSSETNFFEVSISSTRINRIRYERLSPATSMSPTSSMSAIGTMAPAVNTEPEANRSPKTP